MVCMVCIYGSIMYVNMYVCVYVCLLRKRSDSQGQDQRGEQQSQAVNLDRPAGIPAQAQSAEGRDDEGMYVCIHALYVYMHVLYVCIYAFMYVCMY